MLVWMNEPNSCRTDSTISFSRARRIASGVLKTMRNESGPSNGGNGKQPG